VRSKGNRLIRRLNEKVMQKLQVKLKNAPRDASQVPCSVRLDLNKEETLSEQDKVRTCNNSDENHSQHTERSIKSLVYVISKEGKPLMPCTQAKANRMLRKGAAKVIKRFPFTIQLNFKCKNKTQKITLGLDPGYSKVGFSAITEKKELISGELKLDNRMTKRLSDRAMYRRNRRNRLWHRKPRFNNRKIEKGWLPPSIERRYQTHLTLIKKLKQLLPITKIIIEIANFDIQKIENPNIEGKEYQQGTMYEYRNRIAYLLDREKGKCQFCGKEYKKGNPWRLHHIWGKSKDRSQDWALLHQKCHEELHKKKLEKILQNKKSKSYKSSTFMNIIKWKFQKDINCEITFGNVTFQNRIDQNLEKTHYNDAFIISKGKNQNRIQPIEINRKRRNNRCLQKNRKGFKPSIRKQKYNLQPLDLIKYLNCLYFIKGVHCYGKRVILENNKSIDIKKVNLIKYCGGWQFLKQDELKQVIFFGYLEKNLKRRKFYDNKSRT
jgi:hypothetical protein